MLYIKERMPTFSSTSAPMIFLQSPLDHTSHFCLNYFLVSFIYMSILKRPSRYHFLLPIQLYSTLIQYPDYHVLDPYALCFSTLILQILCLMTITKVATLSKTIKTKSFFDIKLNYLVVCTSFDYFKTVVL